MEKKPRVTILMPVYNGARYLRETMDSVLKQTFRDFRFLIVNDGSTDESMDIVASYNDDRIIVYNNEKNLGLVASLNGGLEMIDTEYVARMDADDLWHEDKLEKQIQLLDSRKDVGICGTCINKFGAINGRFFFPEEADALKVGLLFYCMMSHPSVVYRNSFLRETGLRYKADYFPCEDYKMWTDALKITKIYNIQEVLVEYRQHKEQICVEKKEIQKKLDEKIKTEQLRLIYPDCSAEELDFHLNIFTSNQFKSKTDVRRTRQWIEKLNIKNIENGRYVNSVVLKKELKKYYQMYCKSYLSDKYFSDTSRKGLMSYLFSGEWFNLSLRRNISLIKKSFCK